MHGLTGPGRVPFRSTADLATELRPRGRCRTDHLSPDNDRRRRPRSSSPAGPGTSCASTAARTPSPRTSCGTRTTRCAPSCSGSAVVAGGVPSLGGAAPPPLSAPSSTFFVPSAFGADGTGMGRLRADLASCSALIE